MNETIAALVELQTIDDEIRGFALQRDELAGNLERLQSIIERMDAGLAEKRGKLTESQKWNREKRADLKSDTERMLEAKSKLAGVTRTKEYAAAQRELDNLRKKCSDDEAELGRMAEAISTYKSAISVEEAKLAELQGEVDRERASSSDRLEELETQIAKISTRKDAIGVNVERQTMSRYNRILKGREGKAVVMVLAGNCQGCRMKIPPQQFIRVQIGKTIEMCPSCKRFLYFSQAAAAALVSDT